jgi:RNA polymerase sigma-70 factor (ECF subfamily)
MSDQEIIQAILAGGIQAERALMHIYKKRKVKNDIIRYVRQNSGDKVRGLEMFQEAIKTFYNKVQAGNFQLTGKLDAYLYRVGINHWRNKLRTTKNNRSIEEQDKELPDEEKNKIEIIDMDEACKQTIQKVLSSLGDKCRVVLRSWMFGYSMEEIAEEAGLSDAGRARRDRYNCMEKLKKEVERNLETANKLRDCLEVFN